jgi:peptide/nickel transport system permease protein
MATYIVRRILLMIPTLIGMTFVVFFIMQAAPGDVAQLLISREGEMRPGERATRVAYIKKRYGLDRPAIVQYGRWLNKVSPIGFRSSSDIGFDEAEQGQAKKVLADAPHIHGHISADKAVKMTEAIAAYLDDPLDETAHLVVDQTKDVESGLRLLVRLDALDKKLLATPTGAEPSVESPAPDAGRAASVGEQEAQADRAFVAAVRAAAASDPDAAATMLLEKMADKARGLDRVLFTHPAFKKPDFGESFIKNRPVTALLAEALPITLLLNLLSLPLVYTIAIVMGVYAARHRGEAFDVSTSLIMLAMWSIPTMWAGVLLQGFLANKQYVDWFPTVGLHDLHAGDMPFLPHWTSGGFQHGWLIDAMWHLVLPVVCLSYGSFAFVSKLTRGAVLENLVADYVRTARAKGVDRKDVLWLHVFRNSLLPLITVAAFVIPGLLGGSIIVEYIFGIHGMGRLVIDSIDFKDQEVVMAVTLISGVITMVAYLFADLLYAVADPRVAYE